MGKYFLYLPTCEIQLIYYMNKMNKDLSYEQQVKGLLHHYDQLVEENEESRRWKMKGQSTAIRKNCGKC